MPDVSVASSTIAAGVLLGGMLGLIALGLSIILGVMRLVNLAHGEFLLLGAYSGLFFVQASAVDPLLALPVVAIFVAALSVPLYRFLLQPLADRGAEAQMMTMFAVVDHPAERLRARLQRRHALDPGELRRAAPDARPRNRARSCM